MLYHKSQILPLTFICNSIDCQLLTVIYLFLLSNGVYSPAQSTQASTLCVVCWTLNGVQSAPVTWLRFCDITTDDRNSPNKINNSISDIGQLDTNIRHQMRAACSPSAVQMCERKATYWSNLSKQMAHLMTADSWEIITLMITEHLTSKCTHVLYTS